MRNETLFNCCTNFEEPDWSQFDGWEIAPCRTDPAGQGDGSTQTETCEPHEADMWTLYGHLKVGGVDAITDTPTERMAISIRDVLAARSGIQAALTVFNY